MDPDEERLTLAHELAHFLHHYNSVRLAAIAALGPGILPVLDGDRAPSAVEWLSSVLKGVALGCYQHALERFEQGLPDAEILRLETDADLLGLELLAPCSQIAASTEPGESCRDVLRQQYGLPPTAAVAWGGWIDARRAPDALISRLEDYRRKKRDSSVEL
jgi:hypothetical protein